MRESYWQVSVPLGVAWASHQRREMEPFTAGILAVGGMIAVMLTVLAAQENKYMDTHNKSKNKKGLSSPKAEPKSPVEKGH